MVENRQRPDVPVAHANEAEHRRQLAIRANAAISKEAIGVDVQAWDADLDAIAALAKTDGNFIVGNGTAWVAESGATARTSLGLGTAAVQNYQEGTWTPALTFATPGDLSVVYTIRDGTFTKVGRLVTATFNVATSTFTHTTASGNLQLTGLPFAAANVANRLYWGTMPDFQGITLASYTQFGPRAEPNAALLQFSASAQGQNTTTLTTTHLPTGGSVRLRGSITYEAV